MAGVGSPSSAAGALPPPFLLPASLAWLASGAAAFFFSFFSFCFSCFSADTVGEDVEASVFFVVGFFVSSLDGLGAFSFFLEGSAFLSNLGALSKSNEMNLNASPIESAEDRTAAPDWI